MVDYATLNTFVDNASRAITEARNTSPQGPAQYRHAGGAVEIFRGVIVREYLKSLDVDVPEVRMEQLLDGPLSDYAQAHAVANGYVLEKLGQVASLSPEVGPAEKVYDDVVSFRERGTPDLVACTILGVRLAESRDVELVDRVLKETFEMAVRKT